MLRSVVQKSHKAVGIVYQKSYSFTDLTKRVRDHPRLLSALGHSLSVERFWLVKCDRAHHKGNLTDENISVLYLMHLKVFIFYSLFYFFYFLSSYFYIFKFFDI